MMLSPLARLSITGNDVAEPSVPTGATCTGRLGVLKIYTNTISTINRMEMIIKLCLPVML